MFLYGTIALDRYVYERVNRRVGVAAEPKSLVKYLPSFTVVHGPALFRGAQIVDAGLLALDEEPLCPPLVLLDARHAVCINGSELQHGFTVAFVSGFLIVRDRILLRHLERLSDKSVVLILHELVPQFEHCEDVTAVCGPLQKHVRH